MTKKEAINVFHIDAKELDKRIKDGMVIGKYLANRRVVIPDDTKIIPSKKEVKYFLLQILKFKNNPNIVFSRELCPDEASLKTLMDYLYKRGFIGTYIFSNSVENLMNSVSLTDNGIEYLLGSNNYQQAVGVTIQPIAVNISNQAGLINIG